MRGYKFGPVALLKARKLSLEKMICLKCAHVFIEHEDGRQALECPYCDQTYMIECHEALRNAELDPRSHWRRFVQVEGDTGDDEPVSAIKTEYTQYTHPHYVKERA